MLPFDHPQPCNGHLETLTLHLDSPTATREAGLALGRTLPSDAIVLLEGGLGAGKTTLAKAICEGWGIRPEIVISPTYTLVNVYPAHVILEGAAPGGLVPDGESPRGGSVYHVDFYRLESSQASTDALLELDRDDWINPDGPTLIEWPELARPLLEGEPLLEIRLQMGECQSETRDMTLRGKSGVYGTVFAALQGLAETPPRTAANSPD